MTPWHVAVAAPVIGLALAPALAPGDPVTLLAAATAAAVGVALRARGLGLVAAAGLVAGVAIGDARLATIDRPGSLLRAGEEVEGRALLLARPRESPFGWAAEVQLQDGRAWGARLLARGERSMAAPRASPGAELRLRGTLGAPRSDAGFDWAAHLRRRGIALELELAELGVTGRRRGGPAGLLDRVRGRAEAAIERSLSPPRAALIRGMVLGQDERIDVLTRDDFRAAGLGHLLAVSGQNVMLLGALVLPLLVAAGLGPGARVVALLCLIGLYVPLAGAGPSLQRAAVMGAAGLVAIAAARPASRSYALLLAAAVTLAVNPRATGDPGWQLSFAAVAGILWIAPLLRVRLRALPRPLAEGVAISLSATAATGPLVGHHFGALPLAGLPANLLALPAVPVVMWAGMVQCALGQLPALEPAVGLVGAAAAPAADYLTWLARSCAELPGGRLQLPLHSRLGVGAAYAGLAAGAWLVARRRRPGPDEAGPPPARRRRRALVAILAALGALVVALVLRPAGPPARLTVSFLDVGQGDATLIQHPDGTAVLFDGGPPEARVARLLRAAGVHRLDAVVATHASRDHHGGLLEVVERIPVGLVLDGGDGTPDRDFRALLAAARERGARVVPALAPMTLRAGALVIRVLSPRPRPAGPAPEDPNPRAVVAVVSAGGLDVLLSADAESEAIDPLALPDIDAMKVPHHGSADPGLAEILDRLRPELAAIEVGENSYGHPAPSTLRALHAAGVPTYRTDRDGTITLTAAPDGLHVATGR